MTTGRLNVKVWTLALAALAMTATLGAQQPAAPQAASTPQQPASAPQQPTATSPQIQAIAQYIVGQAKPPETPGVPMRDLTLDDAIQIALEKNLDLQVAKMNPLIQDYSLVTARAAFRPTMTGTFGQTHQSSPSTSILDNVTTSTITSQTQSYNIGLQKRLQFYGGQMGLTFTSSRATTNSLNTTRNPNYQSSFRLNFTQPLLVNFAIDNQRNALRTSIVQRQISDVALQGTIENTKASVRAAYWALRQAIERIEIQRLSLQLAQQVVADNKVKVEIGTMAPIDQTTAEVQEAQSEQALLNAQIQWTTAELALKRLLVAGPDDPLYHATLNLTSAPSFELQNVDIDAAIKNALAQRTDIVQQRQNLDVTNMNLEVTKNATKPQLDLTGSYQLAGSGGPQLNRGVVVANGSYFDALQNIIGFDIPTWTVGLNFNYPIGMASAKASLARSEIQRNQALENIKVTELQIATDVTNAGLAVQNSYLQLKAAQKSREAAEKNAAAEQT
ncbi:MAG TPA: TolC family protein, partial [Vicinamibacterales bacterium]|nr:TolC family protein [Vicinamibacterales bacterium]